MYEKLTKCLILQDICLDIILPRSKSVGIDVAEVVHAVTKTLHWSVSSKNDLTKVPIFYSVICCTHSIVIDTLYSRHLCCDWVLVYLNLWHTSVSQCMFNCYCSSVFSRCM